MTRSREEIVRDWIELVWNQGQLDRLSDMHPDEWMDNGGEVRLADAQLWHRQIRSTYPDLHYVIDELFSSDERVVVRWTATGTQLGELWGLIPPSGRAVSWRGIHVLRVELGRIIEIWAVADTASLLQQLPVELRPIDG
ncbi:MAG TPA: ester cyclase [Candidatus Limnocylindria bacterium]|nr:ester cyclase [Candidatus Limnocylindria bacterium]